MPDSDSRFNVEVGKGVSRRQVMKQLGALSAVGGLAGCLQRGGGETTTNETTASNGTGDGGDTGGGSEIDAPSYQRVDLNPPPTELNFSEEPPERKMTMVCHNGAISFWNPTIAGLHDAASQHGWKANF
ncbi:MAG: LacI family transcriptional regulator, partial [Halorhabdus sp.]